MKLSSMLIAVAIATVSQAGWGATLSGVTTSSFTPPTNCDLIAPGINCDLSGPNNNQNTVLSWGSDNPTVNNTTLIRPSTLSTSQQLNFNQNISPYTFSLGNLTWFNSPDSNAPDMQFNWVINVNFAQPSDTAADFAFFLIPLSVENAAAADTIGSFVLPDADSLATALNSHLNPFGFLVSSVAFSTSNISGGDSSYNDSTGIWTNPENSENVLTITASLVDISASVPLPGTLALLCAGMLAFGVSAGRRNPQRKATV